LTCCTLHVHNCGPSHTNQPAHRAHHAQQGHKPTTGSSERARARLVALPGQAALEQEEQRVRQALQVVAAAGGAAQVRVHARIPHRAPARARPPEGALGQKEWLQCESKGAQTAPAILSRSVRWLAAQPRRARRAGSGRQCKRTRTVGYDGWRYAPGGPSRWSTVKVKPGRYGLRGGGRAPEDVRPLVILHVRAADRVAPPRRCARGTPRRVNLISQITWLISSC